MITNCKSLEWLDERRVDTNEKRLIESYLLGGKEKENKERLKIK